MIKTLSKITLVGLALAFSACANKEDNIEPKPYVATFECKQENVLAPRWTCIPQVDGFYAGVGIADKSAAGMAHMRKVAMMNGRSDLTQQIATQVKDKMQGFTQTTGNGKSETVDAVTKAVTDQAANVKLTNSKAIDMWNAPSGALYILMTIPESEVNGAIKNAVKSSFNNDNARWQEFKATQAFDALNEQFPSN
ncbi:LPP20 family lipoprotein [Sulfurimonas sp. SAG-AH-194-L11]|nr:LPP20 family lipoprotein [Sulfurimonas sp. SAG-AH-194-L11]MDF1876620.1 LPP20 family lipoprotein [Sulfurimonas sp. SAG-AH-194-L11]